MYTWPVGVVSSVPMTTVLRPVAGLATAFSQENLPSEGNSQLIPPSASMVRACPGTLLVNAVQPGQKRSGPLSMNW